MQNSIRLLSRIGATNIRVLRGMVFVFLFMLFCKFAGLAKEMAIAARHGTSLPVDIYVFVYVFVSWVPLLFQSIGQSALVPLFARLESRIGKKFYGELLVVTVLIGLSLWLILHSFSNEIILLVAPSLTPDSQDLAAQFTRAIAPCVVLLMLITVVSSELLSREKHANTLAEAIPALIMFVCVLFWPDHRPALEAFSTGILIGLFLQLLVLVKLSSPELHLGVFYGAVSTAAWRNMLGAMSILVVGSIVIGLAKPIDQILAVQYGEGAVSRLSYAGRVLALGIGLGTTVVTRALLPVLSDSKYTLQVRLDITRQWTFLILCAGAVGASVAWWVSPGLVEFIFQRGAFTDSDSRVVTELVRFGLFQIPFVMAGMVMVQFFAGLGEFRIVAVSGMLGAAIKIVGVLPLASLLGLPGIVLSSALMYLGAFAFLVWRCSIKQAECRQST